MVFFTVNFFKPYTERWVEVGQVNECTEGQKDCRLAAQAVAAYHSFFRFPTVYSHILPFPGKQERKGMVNTMLIGASM